MATRKTKQIAQEPCVDQELYNIIKEVYERWSGEQLAQVIAKIRQEIQLEQLKNSLLNEQEQLANKLKELE